MATGQIELIGTQIGSTGSNGGSGNTIAKAVDGDFATFYDAANASNDWLGVDAGSAVTVRTVRFAPRRGDSGSSVAADFENRAIGAKIQASSASDFSSDVTDVLTIPAAPPSYISKAWNDLTLTSPPSKRYWRYLGPASARCNIAELRFIADVGASAVKPVKPVISPYGGRFITGSTTVTLTSGTTSAAIYYTTDGSTPTSGSTLYSVPFSLSIGVGSTKTLKVIAIDGTLATTDSDIASAVFNGYGYKPGEDWRDDHGDLIEAHCGSLFAGRRGVALQVNGYYYWFGNSAAHYSNISGAGTIDGNGADGIWLYKSTDRYNWVRVGNILQVSGGFTYNIRPSVRLCPSTNKYVLWVQVYTIPSGGGNRAAVATADNIEGPWTWVSTNLNPDGIGFLDCTLFQDDDDTCYVIYRNSSNAKLTVSQLASDYLTANISHVFATADIAESPAMVRDHEGVYILFHSAPGNYYDSTASFGQKVAFATTPLGTWTAARDMYIADPVSFPVGGAYNGQVTFATMERNGIYLGTDFWVKSDISASRHIALPVDTLVLTPSSWDLTQFVAPSNSLLTKLAAYWPLSELNSTDTAVERVAGLNATTNGGVHTANGIRLRSRSGRFIHATHATLHTGDIDFTFNIQVTWDGGSNPIAFSIDSTVDGGRELGLYYDNTASRWKFYVSPDGNTASLVTLTSTAAGAMAIGDRMMVTVWHNASSNLLGMHINGSPDATVSHTTGVFVSSTAYTIGSTGTGGNTWGGEIQMHGFWKTRVLSDENIAALWKNGHNLPYEYFFGSGGKFGTVFAGVVR